MSGFSGDFFLPELRSGDGLAREVDGEGEGGRRGIGDVVLGFMGSDRSELVRIWWLFSSGTAIRSGGASGGVLTETRPGMVTTQEMQNPDKINLYIYIYG